MTENVEGEQTHVSLSSLHEAVNDGRFADVADICDALELEVAAKGLEKPDDWPYALHLLGHIYIRDLNSARFLWKRLPGSVKQSYPELGAAWKIGQCMWKYDHAGVHEALQSYSWSPAVQQVVAAFAKNYLRKVMKLLITSYSTISASDAANCLGLTESDAIKCTTQEGWVWDSVSNMLTAPPIVPAQGQKLDSSKLQNLTEYVFHLEH